MLQTQSQCPPLSLLPEFASATPSTNITDCEAQQLQWAALVAKFKAGSLYKHSWEWVGGEFLPIYTFQTIGRITEIWDEYANGLNGFLAVRDLNEHWQARWRRNVNTLRTENCRRKKVTTLVETLARKPNWNSGLALRFLRERYENHPDLKKPRAFCEYLQKGGGIGLKEVLVAAGNFP